MQQVTTIKNKDIKNTLGRDWEYIDVEKVEGDYVITGYLKNRSGNKLFHLMIKDSKLYFLIRTTRFKEDKYPCLKKAIEYNSFLYFPYDELVKLTAGEILTKFVKDFGMATFINKIYYYEKFLNLLDTFNNNLDYMINDLFVEKLLLE